MNKEIIIDGIDVSECEHYRAKLKYKLPFDDYTVEQDKCHYSGIEIIQNCKGNKGCIYKQLKREIKRLKEELTIAQLNRITMFEKLDIVNEKDAYKQALQEIKKYIAKICKEECGYVQKKKCPDSDCRYGQILDKINEVIGAE